MLKPLGFDLACALLSSLLVLLFAFGFAPSSTGIRSDDIALLSGSTSSGLVVESVFSGMVCSDATLDSRPRRRDFFTPLRDCCCCFCCCFCCCSFCCCSFCCGLGKDCLCAWIDICCCPVAATAAALAATLDGFAVATSFSSESDVESENASDVELCLILLTNLSSPVAVFRHICTGDSCDSVGLNKNDAKWEKESERKRMKIKTRNWRYASIRHEIIELVCNLSSQFMISLRGGGIWKR